MPIKAEVNQRSLHACAPRLQPKKAPWMTSLASDPALIASLLNTYSSPLHVVVDGELQRNARDLLAPLKERGLEGGVYFARKANKLPWFVTMAKETGIGVDTASLNELRETLALQVPPSQIIVTAIGKDETLMREAVTSDCLVVIDNTDEIDLLHATAKALGKKARVGLRFAGFRLAHRTMYSRFGLPAVEYAGLLRSVFERETLNVELLHAHIDRYDPSERAAAARKLLEIADHCAAHGCRIRALDLGGGILMRYLEERQEWDDFLAALRRSVTGEQPSFTFQNQGFGYSMVDGRLTGVPDLYPVWNDLSKERFVKAVLDDDASGQPLYKELRGRQMKLFFEPGRSLLDNTGMTLARIAFRKHDTEGNLLLGLNMNRTNLCPFRAEFCSDPHFVNPDERSVYDGGAYLVGNLCSESDFIFKRRIRLPHMPLLGDSVCFFNTSGYLAHHMEIGTHGASLPTNVLVERDTFKVRAQT
jgi:diaminopimelate decarboxylase